MWPGLVTLHATEWLFFSMDLLLTLHVTWLWERHDPGFVLEWLLTCVSSFMCPQFYCFCKAFLTHHLFLHCVPSHVSLTYLMLICPWMPFLLYKYSHAYSKHLYMRRFSLFVFSSVGHLIYLKVSWSWLTFAAIFSYKPFFISVDPKYLSKNGAYNEDVQLQPYFYIDIQGIHTIRFETDTHWPVSVSKRTKYFGNGYPFQKRTSVS